MSITTGTTVYRNNYYGLQTGTVIGVVGTDAVVSWTGGGRNELVRIAELRTEEHVTMADLETGDVVLTDVGAVILTSERRTYPAQRAGDYVVRFESEMIDPDQFEHVAWIVRMNEREGVSRGHWGVQGTQWVTITRLARILP
jgi:hypothetical protein